MTTDTPETTTAEEKLLPCPFCGSASVRTFAPTCKRGSEYDPTDRAFPIVRCGDCFAEACGENWDNSCKTAIKSWNTRAPSPALALAQEAQLDCNAAINEAAIVFMEAEGWNELDAIMAEKAADSQDWRRAIMHVTLIVQAYRLAEPLAAQEAVRAQETERCVLLIEEHRDDMLRHGRDQAAHILNSVMQSLNSRLPSADRERMEATAAVIKALEPFKTAQCKTLFRGQADDYMEIVLPKVHVERLFILMHQLEALTHQDSAGSEDKGNG